jgi:undecaprenyl-diphosphatase
LDIFGVAVVLGVVEGLTEFLPVSSTGHLIIAGHILGFVGEKAAIFEVAIQLGAILSVVLLYWRRFLGLLPNYGRSAGSSNSTLNGWAGVLRLGLATLPALVVGFLARHAIKERLFTPGTVTAALFVGGVVILLVEKFASRRRAGSVDSITVAQSLGVGLFQVLALWPGTSRSAATIVGGMLLGLDRKGAAEFSFLIAVPIMCIATGYEMVKMRSLFAAQDLIQFGIGFVVSFLVALVTVKAFVFFLSRGSLKPFAWYRIIAAPIFYLLTRSLSL